MTFKLYPCRRYHAHIAALQAQQSQDGPPITKDADFLAFACNTDPVAASVPDAEDEFWNCPCEVARSVRQPEKHREALWKTAQKDPIQLMRVRALIELADLTFKDKDSH